MTLGFTSLLFIVVFIVYFSLLFPIVEPTTKDPEMLKKCAFSLGREAKSLGRKSMTQNDRRRLMRYAGVSNWQDLDVSVLFAEFNRGLND